MACILHMDTSADEGLYFLAENGSVVPGAVLRTVRDHAALSMPAVRDLLANQALDLSSLAAIALCNGPGSYTGLRVGLASAKGMAYAAGLPLILHNRLGLLLDAGEDLARGGAVDAAGLGTAGVALKARVGEWFAEGRGARNWPAALYKEAELLNLLANAEVPDGQPAMPLLLLADDAPDGGWPLGVMTRPVPVMDPAAWAQRAARDFADGAFADLASSEPFYLKAAFATPPKPRAGLPL